MYSKEEAFERMKENERSKETEEAEDAKETKDMFLCEGCAHETACDSRGEHSPHILEEQFRHCHEQGCQSFEDDDYWD